MGSEGPPRTARARSTLSVQTALTTGRCARFPWTSGWSPTQHHHSANADVPDLIAAETLVLDFVFSTGVAKSYAELPYTKMNKTKLKRALNQ